MSKINKELREFVKQFEDDKRPRPLKEHLAAELLKQIMNGEREIKSLITDYKTGNVFVCFGFTKEDEK